MNHRKIRVGINGFGRIGRLALRAGFGAENLEFVQINDPGMDGNMAAHLLEFDSTHGRWPLRVTSDPNSISINGRQVRFTQSKELSAVDWSNCDLVLEASGVFKTKEALQVFLDQGVDHVVVSAPVKSKGVPNIVVGVNDADFDPLEHSIVSAASCTTNCLAPVVQVIKDNFGIKHASMTTIHALTNSQSILDAPHKDIRRARALGSLIPTTTGAAKAITAIFPELEGKINGHAVRVPIDCPSLTDIVFEVEKPTTAEEVNAALQAASESEDLRGILGFEERPLVSIDYKTDPRSSIVDALSTLVIDKTHIKIYTWYDNEWAYANRTIDLMQRIAASS
ncbi:ArsJ-associated glyceraldehyde-3-phosphate dehydrogenase [Aliidiomarina haloalkalitolerans]|uniref:Glyceraldehyde-3-phosphate dehydrogenase n=1 Tax=Aliidiomarina haloalkalitolerans TaxID=859059 RepID=A0A432VR03_9GAMM|nr:ArsJ-associated glyceraldehyde-3-phosphate dehydrogenase [Aliidiomarina haloalkalitolerans]MCL4409923.1 ArsJ-associated glyceraldehyde-3-phosphate dehydrogenase [Gammaproteobacteria bacterium]RUO18700.1 type I glyceraldehyde-3-phosphate dehydrogenase [Aliidiomarina haloalkalitolerans]